VVLGRNRISKIISLDCNLRRSSLPHVLEHRDSLLKMPLKIVAHSVQHFNEQGIAYRIKHLIGHLPGCHQFLEAQHRQMLGKIGWFNLDAREYRADRQLPVGQRFDDMNASGVSKSLERLSFEFAQSVQMLRMNHCFSHHLRSYEISQLMTRQMA